MAKHELNPQYVEACENLGWGVSVLEDDDYVELRTCSPAGEDILVSVGLENFVKEVRAYADGFDVNEHVELWLPKCGTNGVPGTARELVEDADCIQEMLHELADALHALDDPAFAKVLEAKAKAEAEVKEQSYVDLLTTLRQAVLSDDIPAEVLKEVDGHINALAALLWPYSA